MLRIQSGYPSPMTAIHSIPQPISNSFRFRSKPVNARAIKAVIPTFKDWDGLRATLDSLLHLKTPPAKIAVANDNVEKDVPAWLADYPLEIVTYPGNKGPAHARNRGFGLRDDRPDGLLALSTLHTMLQTGKTPDYAKNGFCPELRFRDFEIPDLFFWESEIDWCYFTDCGCTHHPDLFLIFEEAWRDCGDCCVAISGPVTGSGPGLINDYMSEQGILNPPLERTIHGAYIPQALITANALIACLPFAFRGGFDPQFTEAAGEDLDIGIRLRELGVIAWAPNAKVAHRFAEDESDFYRRFRRYGRGNRKLEMLHGLPCLRARSFKAEKPEHQALAEIAVKAMQAGYDEAVEPGIRGILMTHPRALQREAARRVAEKNKQQRK